LSGERRSHQARTSIVERQANRGEGAVRFG
jgi:hypothetical protein